MDCCGDKKMSYTKNMENFFSPAGFTLIELLVVVSIIALFATILIVATSSSRASARNTKRLEDISQLNKALNLYFSNVEAYPNVPGPGNPFLDSCANPTDWIPQLVQQKYVGKLPVDPTNSNPACYRYSGRGSNYKIETYMESVADQNKYAETDGGVRNDWYELFSPGAQNWNW